MKNKILKGFTLVELIVVIAIFSILMTGALALVDPVSKINKSSSDFEKTYAYVDNIQDYIKTSVQYADNMWIYQGGSPDLDSEAFNYKDAFYKNIISTKNGSNPKPSKCKIRVMTILNNDTTINGTLYPKGQILMQDVNYLSNDTSAKNLNAPQPQLNETFFSDKYCYDYIISACTYVEDNTDESLDANGFVSIPGDADDMIMINNLAPEKAVAVPQSITASNLGIGIVTYDTSKDKNGNNRFKNIDATMTLPDGSDRPYVYRGYERSTKYSIANIPLLNIMRRKGEINNSYYVFKKDEYGNDTNEVVKYSNGSAIVFKHDVDDITMSSNDNIYIIYSLNDEVNVPQ